MGDGGGDSGDGGSYGYYVGDGGGYTSSNTTASKNPSNGEKQIAFLAMGVMSFMLAYTSAQLAGQFADYSKSTIEACTQATYNVKNEFKPNLLDKAQNVYCEPIITAYVGNERNPNQVKDSDLKSETVNKIADLRSLYIPPLHKSALKNH